MDDRTIEIDKGVAVSLLLVVGIGLLVLAPYYLLWGLSPLGQAWSATSGWILVLALVVGTAAHELIHGVTWLIAGRLSWSSIAFGVHWKHLTPFAHAKVPVGVNAYRIGGLMPCLLLGVIPTCIGVILGRPLLFIFGGVFVALAAGDLLVLILLAGVPSDALVQDHPLRIGCSIVRAAPMTSAERSHPEMRNDEGLPWSPPTKERRGAETSKPLEGQLVKGGRREILVQSTAASVGLGVAFLVAFAGMLTSLVLAVLGPEKHLDMTVLFLCVLFVGLSWHFWSRRKLPMKAGLFAAFVLAAVAAVSGTVFVTTMRLVTLAAQAANP
jgi:hypothetical protein